MHPIAIVAASVAALIHVWFFVLESLWFSRPAVWARFGLTTDDEARTVRSFAFNQGFYNLFLAAGIAGGLLLIATGNAVTGRPIVLFSCACMVGAGVVLVASNRHFAAGGALQAVPPLVVIAATALLG
jgi:putative membrane protein